MAVAPPYNNLSPSTARALDWAAAAALLRSGGPERSPEITVADLLVGVLLSHPDQDGEGTVLLTHFGLTARDVLPSGYPAVDATSLQRWAARVGPDTTPPLSGDADAVLGMAQSLSPDGVVHLRSLLGGILGASGGDLRTPLHQALQAAGTPLDELAGAYQRWVLEPASAGTVAGRALRDMLAREFPQRPVDLPTYASDEVDGGDLIGIRAEVDAFAYLLASRDLAPPLAVGLFGNWGAGKSFLMSAVKRRIEQIGEQVRDDPPQDVRFWKHIRQIEFNAWQYVQGSLWASLLDHIFGALGDLQTVGLLQQRREAVSTELREAQVERLRRADRRQDAAEQVARRVGELADAERQREEGLRLLPDRAAEARAEQMAALRAKAANAFQAVWGTRKSDLVGHETAALLAAVQTSRDEVRRGRALLGPYWSDERVRTAAVVSAAFLAGATGLALLLDAFDLPAVIGWLGPVAAAVPTGAKLLQSVNRWSGERLDELEAVETAVHDEISRRRAELDAVVEQAQRRLEEARTDLEDAREEERAARARSDELQARLGQLTPGRVLGDFLAERSRSDDYRRHLGLLSMVRDDLRQLEDLITQNNENVLANKHDEGQANRIILYIDDLDRCPADKVVEVLEAVHLLLAFRLFVVVVAVDTRWLRHALRTELPALADGAVDLAGDPVMNGHRATPQDYLEKIFQLPFQVQPLADDGRAALIRGLLEPSVGRSEQAAAGDGSTSALRVGAREEQLLEAMLSRRGSDPRREAQLLTLSRDELRFLESLAPLLGDTPRGVKRFVNVFQLLTVLSRADGTTGAPTDREVLAFLAAVQGGGGGVAEDLFERVDAGAAGALGAVVDRLATADLAGRDRLAARLGKRPVWARLDLQRLREPLPLVRRLSFSEQL